MEATTIITTEQLATAVAGKINGPCAICDNFTVLHADFICADCTEPVAETYNNGLTVNDNGYTGIAVTHPNNELAVLVTQEKKFGQYTAWWSDSIKVLYRGSERMCVAVAERAVRRPRG